MSNAGNWQLIPAELQQLNQWCVAGPDKAPYVSGPNGLYRAKPTSGPWHTFADACSVAKQFNVFIGFVLTPNDPFTCIDLDIKDITSKKSDGTFYTNGEITTPTQLTQYQGILQLADSYCELSASQVGLHCWVKGNIGPGRRNTGIEIYSQDRFIICTGQPVSDIEYQLDNGVCKPIINHREIKPIAERQTLLNNLLSNFAPVVEKIELEEIKETHSDAEIWRMGREADNAEKFIELCEGRYEQYHFPSQSEADLALMSIFTFYSPSNTQCRRLFRQTKLGERDKANKNNVYLNRTLKIIRSRQKRDESIGVTINMQSLIENDRLKKKENNPVMTDVSDIAKEMQANLVKDYQQFGQEKLPEVPGLDWPPGITGQLAAFIYNSSPRPVKEVAITAALGFFAGVCGKAYHTPSQSGLNLYIILIARSAIGKESMHSGISLILENIGKRTPMANQFVNFTDFASGPALVKACGVQHSFVNVSGEWGRKLRRLAMEDGREGPMQQLRTAMTNLYQKSGPGSIVGGISYSKREDNVDSVTGISYSMIGETTPGTFFESLTNTMMEDGFLSRFNIIKYDGERPPANPNPILEMPDKLLTLLSTLVNNTSRLVQNHTSIPVPFDSVSEKIFTDFDMQCDKHINSAGDDETIRQMWNRAHLKAWRIACLLAVADNLATPLVKKEHADWGIKLVTTDISIMNYKINSGDVGIDDNSRLRKLVNICSDFITKPVPKCYNVNDSLVKDAIIPRKFLQARVAQIAAFNKHRLGNTVGMDQTIKAAIDNGYIIEMDKRKAVELYGYQGRCFQVISLPE